MSVVGEIQARPAFQIRSHIFVPSGPSGRSGSGVSIAIGSAMTFALSGSGRLPGFPNLRFCSVGFGGLGIFASYEIVCLAGHLVDWLHSGELLPSLADYICVDWIEFYERCFHS
jgi:hypothetical protein